MRDPTHIFEGTIGQKTERLAHAISFIGQAPFLSIPVFILLCSLCSSAADWAVDSLVCVLFATVIPISVVVFYAKKFNNEDCDIVKREDRAVPLLLGCVSYLAGTAVLWLLDSPKIVWVLMFCYFANTFAVFLISLKWKISIHSIGCVGPTMALAVAFGWIGLIFFAVFPPIVWSRYVLKKHTPAQLAGGAALGFVLTGILFLMML